MWGAISSLGFSLIKSAGRGALEGVSDRLTESESRDLGAAQEALANAETEKQRIQAEERIARIKSSVKLRKAAMRSGWSPMVVGQYLVVVPFGLWFASIFLVSIIGPNISADIEVQQVPDQIFDLAIWIVPSIIVGTFLDRKIK